MIETQYITLNMVPSGVLPVLYCSQYDIGRPLGMVVYNGGEAVNLGDYTVTIEATRTDGAAITAAVTTSGNIGAFETTATMTNKADRYGAQLVLSVFGKRVASLPFVMVVVKAEMDENAESIEEDASLYQQYTETVQTLIADIRTAVTEETTRAEAAEASLQSAISAEASARQTAVNNLADDISAEASARQAGDNTLQNAINAETSARTAQDALLQAEIDQIIAPTGEAPSAAEVENARIGANGVTYSTLGDAVRGQYSELKNQLTDEVGVEWLNKSISWWFGNVSGNVGSAVTVDSGTRTWSNVSFYPKADKKYRAIAKSIGYATEVPLVFYLDANNIILGTESVLSSETKYHTVDLTIPAGTVKVFVRNFMNGATTDSTFAVYERYKNSDESRLNEIDTYYQTLVRDNCEKYFKPSVGFYYYTPTERKLSGSESTAWSRALIDVNDLDLDASIVIRTNGTFGRYVSGDAYIYGVTFYDGGESLLSYIDLGSGQSQYDLTGRIPTGARYIALNANRGSAFWITGYKRISQKKPVVSVASCEATDEEIQNADYVCSGSHDEVTIQNAINSLVGVGGTIKLSSGTFYIDAFPNHDDGGYAAMLIPQGCFGVTIEGTLNGYSYEDGTGTLIRVTATCYEALTTSDTYTIIRGGYVNATLRSTLFLAVKSIRIVLPLNQKPICCIDFFYSNQAFCEFVSCIGWTEGYNGTHVTLTTPPPVAVANCIGVRMTGGSNYGVINDYRNVLATGFYEGFKVGGEHVIGLNLSSIFNVYGYTFGNYTYTYAAVHPITLINCCDERNVNLPLFARCTDKQAVSLIDFNIERIAAYTPGGVLGDFAKESIPGQFCGNVSYTIQTSHGENVGASVDVPFWSADGSGVRFNSKNEAHGYICTSAERAEYAPNFGQRIWDTTAGKEVICINPATDEWRDCVGNAVN